VVRWILIVLALVLAGCQSDDSSDEPPSDPVGMLVEAADKIRAAKTFRMEATHSGADYLISVYLGEDDSVPVEVAFRRAVAQYVAEDILQANVSILLGGVTVGLDVYAEGEEQWWRLAGTGWVNGDFAPGFNPHTLIGEETGFQAALAALENLEYIGTDTLEDGTRTYRLSGTANGPDVTALLVGLIEAEDRVNVEVYIDRETHYPVRLIIEQPETITEETPDPTTWTIDVYDIGAEPELTGPESA
jgi:hypothetical protein